MGSITLESIKQLLDNQTKEITLTVEKSIEVLKIELKDTQAKVVALEKKCRLLERNNRKNNVVVFGLKTNETNIRQEVVTELNNLLQVNISWKDINNIYKLGNKDNSPVIVEFVSFLKKGELFQNKDKLKTLKKANIAIANDLCEEDRQEQKILRKHLKLAREKNVPATIRGYKIKIEDKWYTAEQLEKLDTESDVEIESSEDEEDREYNTREREAHLSKNSKAGTIITKRNLTPNTTKSNLPYTRKKKETGKTKSK